MWSISCRASEGCSSTAPSSISDPKVRRKVIDLVKALARRRRAEMSRRGGPRLAEVILRDGPAHVLFA